VIERLASSTKKLASLEGGQWLDEHYFPEFLRFKPSSIDQIALTGVLQLEPARE
jgi:hypothetical protein